MDDDHGSCYCDAISVLCFVAYLLAHCPAQFFCSIPYLFTTCSKPWLQRAYGLHLQLRALTITINRFSVAVVFFVPGVSCRYIRHRLLRSFSSQLSFIQVPLSVSQHKSQGSTRILANVAFRAHSIISRPAAITRLPSSRYLNNLSIHITLS